MRSFIFKLIILFNFFLFDIYGQGIVANTCDSTILTKKEYEKCKLDSVWTVDLYMRIDYLIRFKTDLLPKYRIIRRDLDIPPALQKSLQQFKTVYDTVLNRKITKFRKDMDRNQKYVQPKSYLNSMLAYEVFFLYPDIYAILLNDIHLQLRPKTTIKEQKEYKQKIDNIVKLIPNELYQKVEKITKELDWDKHKLMKPSPILLFQGLIQEENRSQFDIINFLLWAD